MMWLLAALILITVAVLLWMKRGAESINDYFFDAAIVYAFAGAEAEKVAAVTAGKVAAEEQRASMIAFLRGAASDTELEKVADGHLVRRRLLEVADRIAAKDWTIEDVRVQKAFLKKVNPEYLTALNNFNPRVFRKKWPSLFASQRMDALKRLQRTLLKSGKLKPEDKAMVQSVTKLHDLVGIPHDAMQIIDEYGKVLAEDHRHLHPISLLPYPKETVKQAIETALNHARDPEIRQHLNAVLFYLDDFVADEKVPQDPDENAKAWWAHRTGQAP